MMVSNLKPNSPTLGVGKELSQGLTVGGTFISILLFGLLAGYYAGLYFLG